MMTQMYDKVGDWMSRVGKQSVLVMVLLIGTMQISFGDAILQDFESGEVGGWGPVTWSDDAFTSFEVSQDWAAGGDNSLKVTFGAGEWKWGGNLNAVGAESFLESFTDGGTFLVDMFIPADSAGITHIGISIQQPGAAENDWQQVWFEVAENTGVFTIELDVTRENDQPINIILGKTTNGGDEFSVYFDNFRFKPIGPAVETSDPVLISSFESAEDVTDWVMTDWSDDPFQTIEQSSMHATEGDHSMHVTFGMGEWKWGTNLVNVEDESVLSAIQHGGTLKLDMFIPESSAGIGNIGFVIQQPGAEQPADWQQIWYNVNQAAGSFTIDLPFTRDSDGPITFHLGKTASAGPLEGDAFDVYFDNLRVLPNPPPTGPEPVFEEVPILTFEDGTTGGFTQTGFSDVTFDVFEVVEGSSTEGSKAMQVEFTGAEWKWGGTINSLVDLDAMRAINRGTELLVDVIIPEGMGGIQNLGLVLQETDVTDSWQQVWFSVAGETGTFTIKLPYERLGVAPVNIHLGQNSEVDTPYTIVFDNFRVKAEQTGVRTVSHAFSSVSVSDSNLTLAWDTVTDAQYSVWHSTSVEGPYKVVADNLQATSWSTAMDDNEGFFTIQSSTGSQQDINFLYFTDFEDGAQNWSTDNIETDWELGQISGTPESAFSGTKGFGTFLDKPYAPDSFSYLQSPLINLTQVNQAQSVFLSFRYFIETDSEGDGAIVNVIDGSGNILAADVAILTGNTPGWKGILTSLPASAIGNEVRVEWLFFSDDLQDNAAGLFIDDVGIEVSP